MRIFLKRRIFFAVLLSFFLFAGCGKPPEYKTQTDSEKTLVKLINEEYNLPSVIRRVGAALWIYLPREESFLSFAPDDKGPVKSSTARESLRVNFLDGNYADGAINILYDIGEGKSYEVSYGYSTSYTQKYREEQNNILNAVYRAFGGSDNPPDIVVLIVADITQGIEMQTMLAFSDLMRAYRDQGFYEEYTRRAVTDYPVGNKAIIGDKEGRHVDFREIPWIEFITRQIVYRINFKYTKSAFRPGEDTNKELLDIAAETVKAYAFHDFDKIVLDDLVTGKTKEFSKDEIIKRSEELKENPQGKLIHLNFLGNNGD